MPKSAAAAPPEGHYRIAAVSKMTGMPVPTIRMWERRYQVVEPARSSANGRLYSRADIERLGLLKAAVDAGHAIGTVSALSDEQLRARLSEAPARTAPASTGSCRVLVVGQTLAERLRVAWADRSDMQLQGVYAALSDSGLTAAGRTEVVIVEAATLSAALLRSLRQLRLQTRAALVIVVYGFGNRQLLSRLDQEGVIALASPADPAHLARICHLGLSLEQPETGGIERLLMQPAAPRRYDEAFLATVARQPSTVRCECPNHLADLLAKLNAFEQYSLECENADSADISIHALLYSAAAQCRELLEHALTRVLEHEGIPGPPPPG